MQTVHLLYGPVAAGKSTFAIGLADERTAVRFAIDEWMHTLFAPDRPQSMDMAWAMSRVERCRTTIWAACLQILASGRDVVLEIGLLREKDRGRFAALVEASGHRAEFYFVDADPDVRRQRVLQRNAQKGSTYSFDVTPSMFAAIESVFEHPTPREQHHTVVTGTRLHG